MTSAGDESCARSEPATPEPGCRATDLDVRAGARATCGIGHAICRADNRSVIFLSGQAQATARSWPRGPIELEPWPSRRVSNVQDHRRARPARGRRRIRHVGHHAGPQGAQRGYPLLLRAGRPSRDALTSVAEADVALLQVHGDGGQGNCPETTIRGDCPA